MTKNNIIKCKICGEIKKVFSCKCIVCKSSKCNYVIIKLRATKQLKKNPLSTFNFMTEEQIIEYYKTIYNLRVKVRMI